MKKTERRYGQWSGNEKGVAEDHTKCVEEVHANWTMWPIYVQCSRKRGHGPLGLYCKQHAKKLKDRQ